MDNISQAQRYNKIYQASLEAIEHIDANLADKILRELAKSPIFGFSNNNPQALQKINNIKIAMQIVNFLAIDTEDAINIIKNNVLYFFKLDVSLEERITARYNYLGYGQVNAERIALKKAIWENKEILGGVTIGEWITKFEKEDAAQNRLDNSIMNFISTEPQIRKLSETEKNILKKILHAYKKLLALKLVDIFDIAATLKEENNDNSPGDQFYIPTISPNQNKNLSSKFLDININEALKKYPDIGEQLVTSYGLKLKSFPQPVRPSIKNWLSDYTFNMGYDNHTAMTRSEYLFKNENAKILSSQEKEKLAYILKAFDENETVNVDVNNKEILFPQNMEHGTWNNGEITNYKSQITNKFQNSNVQNSKPTVEIIPNRNLPPKENLLDKFMQNNEQRTTNNEQRQPITNNQRLTTNNFQPKSNLQFADDNYFANLSPSYKIKPEPATPQEEPKMSFSSPQKLPFEQMQEKPAPVQQKAPVYPPHRITPIPKKEESPEQKRPVPKNVVNLKEE